ncbi:3-hydroxyacyl-ACP dehydratase [Chitinophaga caeni]|uniref:3-hydroxyacyl-ACP dehydratase n=1 Tax=Chitinophaga caeni TaxID=2029983 RepID=A0A291QUF2_9BACT|nr:3-hydroxyacyl-ACP dehydratase [Chitinophaga caeni]ATL47590.1 3-hydroxyacyl-ACP dehydratase [Chitinophaga caeni]
MLVQKEQITDYIPQRPPMVMIDTILKADENILRTGFYIEPGNVFVENGSLMPPGLMENIAQTAAARVGYIAKQKNEPVPLGFIGAVKDLEILQLPKMETAIETEIVIEHEVFNATVVTGKVWQDGQVMAQCEMKIFVPKK